MNFLPKYVKGTLAGEVPRGTANIPGKDDDKKLFVGGLSPQTSENELRQYFGKFGEIQSLTVKLDPFTGQSRCFAFIVFFDARSIDILLASGDHYINNRKVDPRKAVMKAEHRRVFVGGVTPEMTDEDLKNFFSQFGYVLEVQSPYDKLKNQRKGFCFITFESIESVSQLLRSPIQTINGKAVEIKKVRNKQTMWSGNNHFFMKPWSTVNSRYPNQYGYSGDCAYSYDGYAAYGDYGYYEPLSGEANNNVGVQPQPPSGVANDNVGVQPKPPNTSDTDHSAAPLTGSGGTGSSGRLRQFQRHQPY